MMSETPIRVGDHVTDRDAENPSPALVVSRPGLSCDEYEIDESGRTVADVNPKYAPGDGVINVVFVDKTAGNLSKIEPYAYPADRLNVVASLHGGDDE
jgi:hypothetical protein